MLPLVQTQGHQSGQDGLSCSALYVIGVPEQIGLDSFLAEGFSLICLVVWLVSRFSGLCTRDPKSFRLSWGGLYEMILWKRNWANKLLLSTLASSRKTLG